MLSYKTITSEQSQCAFKVREEKKFSDFITSDLNWYRCHIEPTLTVGLKEDTCTEPRQQDTFYCPRPESVCL